MKDYLLMNEIFFMEFKEMTYDYELNEYNKNYKEVFIKTFYELVNYCIKRAQIKYDLIIYNKDEVLDDIYCYLISEYNQEIDEIEFNKYIINNIINFIRDI